jgi:glycosyltransferase AglE
MKTQTPSVSVIIPVFNDATDLKLTLVALQQQDYARDQLEIIVVDNGSSDQSITIAQQFTNVHVICEHHYIGSPYSARNRGLEIAKGQIIALLDATCLPTRQWVSSAIKALIQRDADLVGGEVSFRFVADVPSLGEMCDAISNINMRDSILENDYAKTANLFIKKEVFDKIGYFPEGLRSGGDVRWTKKATENGFVLIYSQEAEVIKKARPFKELLKKTMASRQRSGWYMA